jgi:hypothetical protein
MQTQTPELRAAIVESETALESLRAQLADFTAQLATATADEEAVLKGIRAGDDVDHLTASANRKSSLARIVHDVTAEVDAAAVALDRQHDEAARSETLDALAILSTKATEQADAFGKARARAARVLAEALDEMQATEAAWVETRNQFGVIGRKAIDEDAERFKQKNGAERKVVGETGVHPAKVAFAAELLAELEEARGVAIVNVKTALPSKPNVLDPYDFPKPEEFETPPMLACINQLYIEQTRTIQRPIIG